MTTHHRHSGKIDSAERQKMHTLSAAKRRKIIKKVLFVTLCILAVMMTLTVAWAYLIDSQP